MRTDARRKCTLHADTDIAIAADTESCLFVCRKRMLYAAADAADTANGLYKVINRMFMSSK
jgi:hypothetical protein